MPGALTTKQILDGSGAPLTMRVWDESGVGTGPFSFVSFLSQDSLSLPGQQAMAQSASVAIANDQTPVPFLAGVSAAANNLTDTRINAAASTNAANLKGAAGKLYTIDVFNVASYTVFLKFYNKASNPTVGTDVPVWTVPIPAGSGYSKTFYFGKGFAAGISLAITKLQADADTTAVAAGDVTGFIGWI